MEEDEPILTDVCKTHSYNCLLWLHYQIAIASHEYVYSYRIMNGVMVSNSHASSRKLFWTFGVYSSHSDDVLHLQRFYHLPV